MERLLITGATGFVGGRLARALAGKYELLTPGRAELDLFDAGGIARYLRAGRPTFVVHAAALADTGYCEAHPQESEAVNLRAPEALAAACAGVGAKLVVFSSDQVYNGTELTGPLSETAPLAPVNVYGRHKLEAERRVLAACPGAVCLRASWMYDLPVRGLKNSTGLPGRLYGAALSGRPLALNPREWRGVTWVSGLTEQFEAILQLPGGAYNAGAENTLNSLETGRAMAARLGLPENTVCAVQDPRPRNLAMDTAKLRAFGIELGNTLDSLAQCLREYGL